MDCLNSSNILVPRGFTKKTYALIDPALKFYISPNVSLRKLSSNYAEIGVGGRSSEIKLLNSPIVVWNDNWTNKSGSEVDPGLESLDFANSKSLLSFNSLSTKFSLKRINLRNCASLENLTLIDCPQLSELRMDNCTKLKSIQLGKISTLQKISLRGCNLSEDALEQALFSITPRMSLASYENSKYVYTSYLDLRGNIIPWNHRRIASKIRMMVLNNFAVLWDNNPPEEILPINYYRHYG